MLGRVLTPLRLAAAALVVLVVVAVILVTSTSDKFLEVPDAAHPLGSLVQIPGGTTPNDGGGIYYVDVVIKRASLLESTFSLFRPNGSDLVPSRSFLEPGISYQQQLEIERETMKLSQEKASVVALRALGFKVPIHEGGVRIIDIERNSHARGLLKPQDVVVSADGRTIRDQRDLFGVMSRRHVGETVRIAVLRGTKLMTFTIRTIADQREPRRAIIGFIPFEVLDVHLPFAIHFNLRNVGGPSAGLPFALELLEKRGRDVDHGLKVAATGEIQLDGTVTRIGGVKQKTIGARQAHVDVFLVPVDGDNAREAKRYAHGLRIIPVETFQQALRALATLPKKR